MDFPNPYQLPRSITSYGSNYSGGRTAQRAASSSEVGLSASWATANKAYIIPFWLPWPYPVRRVFWGNGATLTGTKDFGIYTFDGAKIYTAGSTAEAGASALQYVTPTQFTLYPGRYYMAVSCSATTGHCWSFAGVSLPLGGILQMLTAHPLPDSLVFAASTTTQIPLCGVTRYA